MKNQVTGRYEDPLKDWRQKCQGEYPATKHGEIREGDFVIGLPETRDVYTLTSPGVLCFVVSVFRSARVKKRFSIDVEGEIRDPYEMETIDVIPLSDKNRKGDKHPVNHLYFRKATKEEVENRIAEVMRIRKHMLQQSFRTGDPVELTRNVKVWAHGSFSSGMMTLKKGSSCIVDVSPGEDEDGADDTSRVYSNTDYGYDSSKMVEIKDIRLGDTKYTLRQFVAPSVSIYFPDLESEELVPIEAIRSKQPEMQNVQIILPKDYMEKLRTICKRVTDQDVHETVYDRLGLYKVCQKGRGAIALLYGPPGTGKTMTAEVLAEHIGRPLIKLNLGNILNPESMTKKLKEGFVRAKRYKAVLLLDEVDVFIRRRGGAHPVFDENTSTFLRVLEWYDGILLMTTNLVNSIDPAIFSRVHVTLEYGNATKQDRRDIWASMIPKDLKESLSGSDSHHDNILDELSNININGREIKMVIQNVVTKSLGQLGSPSLDLATYDFKENKPIKIEHFLHEARLLQDQREALRS